MRILEWYLRRCGEAYWTSELGLADVPNSCSKRKRGVYDFLVIPRDSSKKMAGSTRANGWNISGMRWSDNKRSSLRMSLLLLLASC